MAAKVGKKTTRWWDDSEGGELHERLLGNVKWLEQHDASRLTRFLRSAQLYSNRAIAALNPSSYDRIESSPEEDPRLNVVRSMVDSVQAKIAKNRPRATFLTERGSFTLQQQARRLEQFCWGIGYREGLQKLAPQVFRDACVFGTGVMKVSGQAVSDGEGEKPGTGRICYERVFPWELHVDPMEAAYGAPRSLFHCRLIDRGVLRSLFGDERTPEDRRRKLRTAIDTAEPAKIDGQPTRDALADQVLVVEAWHLPSGEGAKDGLHAIAIENATLWEERYHEPRFPFATIRWNDPLIGFWGESLTEEVEGLQLELNELMLKVQKAFYYHSVPTILSEKGSVDVDQLDNDLRGRHVEYSGAAPQFVAPPAVGADVFQHMDRIYQRTYEIAGISQLAAQSKKPAGLDSGVALREYNDIESERFVIRGQDFEEWFIEIARLTVQAARDLDERGYSVEVKAEDKRRRRTFLTRIKWEDVALDDDAFSIKIFPASSLPQSPAGRIAAVESLFQAGLIDQPAMLQLLDFPDLDATMSRELAPYDLVLDQIESILDDGEYVAPEPFQDLAQVVQIGNLSYLRAKMDRVPEDRLQMLRDFVDAAARLEAEAMPAAAPAAPMAPAAPAPMPAPTGVPGAQAA